MSQLLERLKRARTHVWVLQLMYAVQVLGFAAIYSQLPQGSFAQMTAQMEPSYLEALEQAEDALEREIRISDVMGSPLHELAIQKQLGEDYHMRVRLRPATGPAFGHLALTITMYPKGSEYGGDMYFRLTAHGHYVTFFADCQDCRNETVILPKGFSELQIPDELSQVLYRVFMQQKNWLMPGLAFIDRYLYYSAITSTTVGYGDIVPLTSWARMLCAIQSFASIVLLGLLINALWLAKAIIYLTDRLQRRIIITWKRPKHFKMPSSTSQITTIASRSW